VARTEIAPTSLNKIKLADALADRMGLSRTVAYEAVENVFDIMAVTVAQGGSVSITNFGGFALKEKRARLARNPQNGEPIQVPQRKGIKFSVSPRLNDFANSDTPERTTIRKHTKAPAPR
jgi:DNA-binding protein HU-beta